MRIATKNHVLVTHQALGPPPPFQDENWHVMSLDKLSPRDTIHLEDSINFSLVLSPIVHGLAIFQSLWFPLHTLS
jgi:hypothetical protein